MKEEDKKCSTCGKIIPKILSGYHVSELCWCNVDISFDKKEETIKNDADQFDLFSK